MVSSGTTITQVCDSDYSLVGETVATCNNGTWNYSKNNGHCIGQNYCMGNPKISSPIRPILNNGAYVIYNSSDKITINGITYYSPNTIIDTDCDSGYIETCPTGSSCRVPFLDSTNQYLNSWMQCENGTWKQHGGCRLPYGCTVDVSFKITGCSNCDKPSWTCKINQSLAHGETWDSGTLGSYKNMADDDGCTDDSGFCRVKVSCNDGTLTYDNPNTFGFSGTDWNESKNCGYDRDYIKGNVQVKGVCCDN